MSTITPPATVACAPKRIIPRSLTPTWIPIPACAMAWRRSRRTCRCFRRSHRRAQGPASRLAPLWMVDPLDGTKEFIAGTGEFHINIALIDAHRPVLGVLYIPLQKVACVGVPGGAVGALHGG